jgi:hypothetical protein
MGPWLQLLLSLSEGRANLAALVQARAVVAAAAAAAAGSALQLLLFCWPSWCGSCCCCFCGQDSALLSLLVLSPLQPPPLLLLLPPLLSPLLLALPLPSPEQSLLSADPLLCWWCICCPMLPCERAIRLPQLPKGGAKVEECWLVEPTPLERPLEGRSECRQGQSNSSSRDSSTGMLSSRGCGLNYDCV